MEPKLQQKLGKSCTNMYFLTLQTLASISILIASAAALLDLRQEREDFPSLMILTENVLERQIFINLTDKFNETNNKTKAKIIQAGYRFKVDD